MSIALITVGCASLALAVGFVVGVLVTRRALWDCEAKLDLFLTQWVDVSLARNRPPAD